MTPDLEKLRQEVLAAAEGWTTGELSWHPAGKWCAAEVFEHLYLTYTGTIKGFERAEAGGLQPGSASWRQRGRKLVVLGLGYMPSGREAPPMARPRGLPAEQVLAEIGHKITEMDAAIRRSEEKHGNRRILLDHPILGPLTGPQWRNFHLVHGRHHVKQIRALRRNALGTGVTNSAK